MNQTLLKEIDLSIEAINSATTNKGHEIAVSNFASAIIRQLYAYSRSSYTNFAVQTNALQLPGHRADKMPIEEAGGSFQFTIESLNNLQKHWIPRYSQYYIQIEAVHGKMSYPLVTLPLRALRASEHDFIMFEEQVTIQTLISALPRNTSLSFVVFGVPFPVVSQTKRRLSQTEDVKLASGVLPVFDHNDVMIQGPVMLALTEINNGRILPWGPQRLIYQPADTILLLQFPEYEHNIVFPAEIQNSQFATFEYERLSEEDHSCIEWLIQHRYIHLFELHDDYKKLLWSKRAYLTKLPLTLPLVLVSAFAWDSVSVSNVYVLLDVWADLAPEDALELLLPCFSDQRVRAKALEWIGKGTSAQLINFIPQILEALRYEQYEDSAIAKFLLHQACKNRSYAFELYWQLNQRLVVADELRFRLRYKLIQDQLLELNIPGFKNDLSYQHVFLDKLDSVYKRFKNYTEYNQMNDVLRKTLRSMAEHFDISRLRLPLCPSFQCKELLIDKAIHFNSAAKPIALHFAGENAKYSIIYKVGDDLRQDAVVMQLVTLINGLWNQENLDMRMITFKCLATGKNKGLVEMVSDCQTLREIQVTTGLQGVLATKVLNDWIKSNNPSEFLYKQAVENFRKSCAGWSIVSYILGLSDRHNDNMMLCRSGHLFHIDFGKYLGDVQMAGSIKRDRVAFVITQEMANVINQGGLETTEWFQQFVDEMCSAFLCLRKRASVIVNTMRLMLSSGVPGLNENAVTFVEEKLMLDQTEEESVFLLTTKIVESMQSVFPRMNFIAHTIAQGRGNIWELLFGNNVTDFDHMPFNLEDCSKETDGEIVSVYVQGFRKMRDSQDGTKVYMYDCKVQRKNMAEDPVISRSYDDFRNLYLRLCYKFPNIGIPNIGRSRFLVRSNVSSVASERFIELQHFLQMLFVLPAEISHCKLIYNFFHHTLQDSDKNGTTHEETSHIASAELDLSLKLNQNNFTFTIRVGHARRLQLNGNNETYVKFYLRTRDSLDVGGGKKKTEIAKGMNPTYNKSLTYNLSAIEMAEIFSHVLHVAIWQKTGSIVKDSFAVCKCMIVLSSLKDIQPNADKVIEKTDTYRLFYLQ
ncbi:Phosphatidylinositol 3-and 4-kinase [Aphelenchoides bicaudatus]|nr:Phosphatidylinositol 3-and 4-kinase [Aphelenchoides bicaudatus]